MIEDLGVFSNSLTLRKKSKVPQEWAISLRNSHLRTVRSHWVSLHQIINYKSYLNNKYIARSEDSNRKKFEVREFAIINFGYGEIQDQEGYLRLTRHNETAFIRFTMDTVEKPTIASFVKKKQCEELNPADLQSRTKVVGKEEKLNNIIAPFHTPYVYVQKRLFVLLLNTPRAPYSMLGHVTTITQQLRTKTI